MRRKIKLKFPLNFISTFIVVSYFENNNLQWMCFVGDSNYKLIKKNFLFIQLSQNKLILMSFILTSFDQKCHIADTLRLRRSQHILRSRSRRKQSITFSRESKPVLYRTLWDFWSISNLVKNSLLGCCWVVVSASTSA